MKSLYIKTGAVLIAMIVKSEILTLALLVIGIVILVDKVLGAVETEEARTRNGWSR